jgi:hypothetical protein
LAGTPAKKNERSDPALLPQRASLPTTRLHAPDTISGTRSMRVAKVFRNFDIGNFWKRSEYATNTYVGRPLDDATVRAVEQKLGYKLPASYVEFMKFQNGGIPCRTNHRTSERTSWSHDHIAITGIYSVGNEKSCSLCGGFGSQFWIDGWGYPPSGVYFADCPSAGHDMICLDYSKCGPKGEPRVVHIDQEWNYKVVIVAPNFESFIRGLEDDAAFEDKA